MELPLVIRRTYMLIDKTSFMRRCGRVPTRQVSSCSLLLSSWAVTHVPTHSHRPVATTTSVVADGEGASSTASAPSSPNSSEAAPNTTAAAPVDTAGVPYAPHSSSAGTSALAAAAANAPSYVTVSSASLAEMTHRLREALRALSEVERAKAELANRTEAAITTSGQKSSATVGEGRVARSTAVATHHSSAAVSPEVVCATSTITEPMTGGSNSFSSSRSGSDVGAVADANATSRLSADATTSAAAAMPSSTSPSWIRNKKPKFWALVNEAGADDVEACGSDARRATAPTAPTCDDRLMAAPSRPEASPSTGKTASMPLTATPPAFSSGAAPLGKTPSPVSAEDEAAQVPFDVPDGSSSASSVSACAVPSAAAGGTNNVVSSIALKETRDTFTPHGVRISTSVSPFRNRYRRDVAHVLSELLSSDPALGPQLLGQLSAESRRLLLIMGAASEYFGVDYEEVAEQVKEADTDRDNSISSKEYDAWVRRMADSTPAKRRHAREGRTSTRTSAPAPSMAPASAQGAAAAAAAVPSVPSTAPLSSSRGRTGATPSVGAAASTLSRQRAEVAVGTAKAATARIVGVIQKSASSVAAAPVSRDDVGGRPAASASITSPTPASLHGSTVCSSRGRTSDAAGGGAVGFPSPPSGPAATASSVATASSKQDSGYIPWPTYLRIVAAAAPPFLAFGMLDNSTLVLAGGAIDNALSGSLGLSQMAAASLGGVVSGVAGIQVHGLAERYTRAAPPRLSAEQQRSDFYSRATQVGNTMGMVVGLVLGMVPLLFMSGSTQLAEQEERDRHHFRQEAARSHQRQCKAVQKEEVVSRQQLWEEERAAREALTRDDDQHRFLSLVQD
ncbi:hypothetical protein GH5_07583 [Leishmania sp. Ghana 2012 LV757]|uniref:hypothetical protein n=1 Tax=Leishmania sp. Ghana 2012 LV757 TaxID=2803181 RepID=UPI001B49FD12|nr:hypothetical protein GH5_07583 [Leishmania sp. Ghana 2012 LV757]